MLQLIGPRLHALVIDILRLSLWLALLAVIFVPLERLFAPFAESSARTLLTDLGYYFLSGLLPALLFSVPLGLLAWAVHHAVPDGVLTATAALPLGTRVLVGLVAGEVGYYWGHRWSHEVPFLWRFHAIHHSARKSTSWSTPAPIRSTWSSAGSAAWCRCMCWAWAARLALRAAWCPSWYADRHGLGLLHPRQPALAVRAAGMADLHPGVPPLAPHLDGPINRNYASTLPWLDRIFGTHYLPKEWPSAYGIEAEAAGYARRSTRLSASDAAPTLVDRLTGGRRRAARRVSVPRAANLHHGSGRHARLNVIEAVSSS